jgi:putative transposase
MDKSHMTKQVASMAKKETQLKFQKTSGWGGKRKGTGRKNLSGTVNHMTRPEINLKTPLHINLKLIKGLPNLRKNALHAELKKSIKKSKEQGLYILHYSIQDDHIHLFAEAKSNSALAAGMRSLAGRFAKIIRQYAYNASNSKRQGSVFKGRYYLHVLKTPREVKNALEYVLLNLSKHQKFIEYLDHFSSAPHFEEWKLLLGPRYKALVKFAAETFRVQNGREAEDVLSLPQSWLARVGWQRAC